MRKGSVLFLAFLFWFGSCQRSPEARRNAFYESGQKYFREGKYAEATIEFRNALQLDSRHLPSQLGLARLFQKTDNHQQALAAYLRIIEIDAKNVEAKLAVGDYHLVSGSTDPKHFSEARRLAEDILAQDPKDVRARILLGNAYAGLQDFERSIEEMKDVLAQEPENLAASLNLAAFQTQLRDPVSAEKTFLEAVSRHPASPEARRALGGFYTVLQRLKEAEAQFRRAYELAPGDAANMYALVGFFLGTKQPAEAESALKAAIRKTPDWSEPSWALANFYVSQGKYKEARAVFKTLREEDLDNRLVRVRLAEVHVALNDTKTASGMINQLLKGNPNDAEAHFLQGRLLDTTGKQSDALKEYAKAVELNRNLVPAYRAKVVLHLKRMEFVEARLALNEILRVTPQDMAVRGVMAKILALTGQSREALEEARVVLNRLPGNLDARIALGEAALNTGQLSQAREEFEALLKSDPNNAFFLHRLGRIELLNKKQAGAIAFFSRALQTNPNLVDVIRDYLAAYVNTGDYQTAQSIADRFLKTTARKDILHMYKGEMYFQEKKYPEAEAQFRKAVALQPKNFGAYLSLGQVKQAQKRMPEAIREVDNLITREPGFAPAYLLKAFYMETGGDAKGAIAHYQKTLELSPDNPVAANNMAWLYCQSNRNLELALTLARKARETDPNNGHIADTLGWIYYKMGNYRLAADQLTFAVNQGARGAENYYRLGMACYRKGDKLIARQSLRRAVELNPRFTGAEEAKKVLQELG